MDVNSPPTNHQSQLLLTPQPKQPAAASDSAHLEADTPSHGDTQTHEAFTLVLLEFHVLSLTDTLM